MPIKNFLSGGRELAQISKSRDVNDLKTWAASLFKRTIDSINQTNQAAVGSDEVTGSAAQVVATPATSSGTAAPTTLTATYLANAPATADDIGAVKPDGTTITVSAGGVLSATAGAPPSGPANQVFATPNGSAGDAEIRALVPTDLPVATTSDIGAVKPDGTTITISAGVISAVGGGGGGGALVLLQEQTASNSATLDFTSWYGSDYDSIFIELVNVTAATSGVGILMQVSTDGGSTWDTGGNYDFFDWPKGVSNSYQGYSQHNGESAFQWWGPDANDLSNSFGFSGTGHLLNVTGPNIVGKWSGIGQATSGAWYEIEYGAAYMGTGPVNGLQFLVTSGNIASGTIRIYGLSNT